jgi:septal ring-binding cell division protein DamX
MANARKSSGLTIGQLLTLTFGFLVASVAIFLFGMLVGRDMADQRMAKQQQVTHLPAPLPPTANPQAASPAPVNRVAASGATETPFRIALGATPTAGRPTAPASKASATPTAVPKATPTHLGPMVAWGITPTKAQTPASAASAASAGGFTVQVSATNDAVQAVMLARRLRAKGFDAYTTQGPIGGVTWYRVRVGRFADREAAKAMETRLRRDEQLEAAYVAPQ